MLVCVAFGTKTLPPVFLIDLKRTPRSFSCRLTSLVTSSVTERMSSPLALATLNLSCVSCGLRPVKPRALLVPNRRRYASTPAEILDALNVPSLATREGSYIETMPSMRMLSAFCSSLMLSIEALLSGESTPTTASPVWRPMSMSYLGCRAGL